MLKFLLIIFVAGEPAGAVPVESLDHCLAAKAQLQKEAPEGVTAACYARLEEA